MDGIDTVFAKEVYQSAYTARINRPSQAEHFWSEADAPEMVAEPPDSVRRTNRKDRVASTPQLLG
jgi:hypothetical protein